MQSNLAFSAIVPGQGGRLAAIMRGPIVDGVQRPPYALIQADKSFEVARVTWGEYKAITGADSRTNGRENTAAMVKAKCPAAQAMTALEIEGHADYYLASLGEMNCAAANAPELFDPKGIYWTSTQYSRYLAFVQDFEYGGSGWFVKDNEFRAVPVRQISLELLNA